MLSTGLSSHSSRIRHTLRVRCCFYRVFTVLVVCVSDLCDCGSDQWREETAREDMFGLFVRFLSDIDNILNKSRFAISLTKLMCNSLADSATKAGPLLCLSSPVPLFSHNSLHSLRHSYNNFISSFRDSYSSECSQRLIPSEWHISDTDGGSRWMGP